MIGSTKKDDSDPIPRDLIEGNPKQKMATVQGLQIQNQILQSQIENLHDQMRRLTGAYQTLAARFDQFEKQRVVELNAMVNGGPTERLNGSSNRSSD